MSIKTEYFEVNGRDFIRTYSDAGRYVVRDGIEYEEACDPAEFGRTYTEGEVKPYGETEEAHALTRYINEQTGANDRDIVAAAETLIKNTIMEG